MGKNSETLTAIAAVLGATASTAAVVGKKSPPKGIQPGKSPDAGMTDKEKRNKLLAQLAAGAARNNPTGGLAGTPNTGSLTLGG